MHEHYHQSGYSHEEDFIKDFLLFFILAIVHDLHSYEYADGNPFLSFLVK